MISSRNRLIFGTMIMLAAIGGMIPLYFRPVPEGNHDLIAFALGQVFTLGAIVINFSFGSSEGSKAKQDTLDRIATGPQDVTVTDTRDNLVPVDE